MSEIGGERVPDTKDDGGSTEPSRAVTAWTQGLLCVAIVAGGVIVGGLLHDREPELTTTPVSPTSSALPQPAEYSYVTPTATYPTQIPGCTTVEPPGPGGLFSFLGVDEFGYDNPAYPWFSGPKAVAMSRALHEALPGGITLEAAPEGESLFFEPILDPSGDSDKSAEFGGSTTAHATLRRGNQEGWMSVSVRQSTAPIPPCVAGDLDERRLLADGTTVDTDDTWSESSGVRTLSRSATAYVPDGSTVTAYVAHTLDGNDSSGTVPMTIDELVALVTAPGVRVTAPVPPGTPDVPK